MLQEQKVSSFVQTTMSLEQKYILWWCHLASLKNICFLFSRYAMLFYTLLVLHFPALKQRSFTNWKLYIHAQTDIMNSKNSGNVWFCVYLVKLTGCAWLLANSYLPSITQKTINFKYEFYGFLWLMYSTLEILMNEKVNSYNFCSNWTPNAKID